MITLDLKKKPLFGFADADPEEKAKLPPEMFVPNQKRWLELRAKNRRSFKCLCACNDVVEK